MGKIREVCLAETVVLHGKFLQVLILLNDTHNFPDRIPRQQVPWDVQELQFSVLGWLEYVPTDVIGHLAMVEAQDFQHRELIAHISDALSHLTWQLVVAKIKRK